MNGPKGKYAWTATVGEKGQIVIPKQAREIFGIHPGDTLLLLGDEKQGIAIPPKYALTKYADIIFAEMEGKKNRAEGKKDRAEGKKDRAEGKKDRAEGEKDRTEGEKDRTEGEKDRTEGEK